MLTALEPEMSIDPRYCVKNYLFKDQCVVYTDSYLMLKDWLFEVIKQFRGRFNRKSNNKCRSCLLVNNILKIRDYWEERKIKRQQVNSTEKTFWRNRFLWEQSCLLPTVSANVAQTLLPTSACSFLSLSLYIAATSRQAWLLKPARRV